MAIRGKNIIPVGMIQPFAGATIPAGFLECAGQPVSRATYAALFTAIGETYGAGDGATTFNLPDLRGRALFGKDNMNGASAGRLNVGVSGFDGATLGAAGGGETVTIGGAQSAVHTHQVASLNATFTANPTSYAAPTSGAGSAIDWQTAVSGAGGAHVNVPPGLIVNYIIKT